MASLNPLRPLCGRVIQSFNQPTVVSAFARPAAAFAPFSTSSPQHAPKFLKQKTRERKKVGRALRRRRDQNKQRGVSSLYRSGPKEANSMSGVPLPKPVDYKPKIEVDKNHGLWGFFSKPGVLMETPEDMVKHGRAWTVEELRRKSWEDLHGLWWACCKELNMLSTAREELKRSKMGFGDQELVIREKTVRTTQRSIKHTLTERFYTWEEAAKVARSDPEIDLDSTDGNTYIPGSYEAETVEESMVKKAEEDIKGEMKEASKEAEAEKQPS